MILLPALDSTIFFYNNHGLGCCAAVFCEVAKIKKTAAHIQLCFGWVYYLFSSSEKFPASPECSEGRAVTTMPAEGGLTIAKISNF